MLFVGFSTAVSSAVPAVKEAAKPRSETAAPTSSSEPTKPVEPKKAAETSKEAAPAKDAKPEASNGKEPEVAQPTVDPDDPAAVENADAAQAAVALPVSADPIQVYGWQEQILVEGVEEKLKAKLDTGAYTSSIHAEEKELFERDGKKWVRFIVTDPTMEKPARTRIEAPLVRIARIKEPGGESVPREVVRLRFEIGDRKMRGEFTLNNRGNMLAPVLIGRTLIRDLGMVDPGRTNLADKKVFR